MADSGSFGGTVVPAQYQAQVLASASRWNINPAILAAQINAESSFNPSSVSSAGAVGIAQFLPSTAAEYGIDPYNTSQAIDGMAMLDSKYVQQFGSIDDALAAYNAGPGAVSQYGGIPPYAETQQYVQKILAAAQSGDATVSGGAGGQTLVDNTSSSTSSDPLSAATHIVSNFLSPQWWLRIGVGVLGVVIILAGIYFGLAKDSGGWVPSSVKKLGGKIKNDLPSK